MIDSEVTREEIIDRTHEELHDVWVLREGRDPELVKGSEGDGVWSMSSSGAFRYSLVAAIDRSDEIICLASFLISDYILQEALLNAASRGVRVYILSAPNVILKQEIIKEEDPDLTNERIEKYKEFLSRAVGKVLLRSAHHFHSKFLLIDPSNKEIAQGFLSTANFNAALVENPEIGIELTYSEIQDLFKLFVRCFWLEAIQEHLTSGVFRKVSDAPESIEISRDINEVLATIGSEQTDVPLTTLQKGIEEFIQTTKGPLYVSTYGLEHEHNIFKLLLKTAEERELVMFVRPRTQQVEAYRKLESSGAKIIGHEKLHAKSFVSTKDDEVVALVLTANLQTKGMDEGFETGVYLTDIRAERVLEIMLNWENDFPYEFFSLIELGKINGYFLHEKDKAYVKEQVHETLQEEGETLQQRSLEVVPVFEYKGGNTEYCHELLIKYKIRRPRVPSGAKRTKDSEFKVYKKGKEFYIGITEMKQIEDAQKIKNERYKDARIVLAPRK